MSNYENHDLKNSEMPFIYKSNYVSSDNNVFWGSNWHENIEIIYITEGQGVVADNAHCFKVKQGDALIINSNHVHALASDFGNMFFKYLIIDRSFCTMNGIDTNILLFEPCLRADARLGLLMSEIDDAYAVEDDFRTLRIRSASLKILLYICSCHSVPMPKEERSSGTVDLIKKAVDYIHASYNQNFSLEDVADFIGINKYYLSHEFSKYTGYSFVTYVNRTRCKNACRLLDEGSMSVFEVGRACGFENRSYFAKTFKKYIGVLPSEYVGSKSKE